MESDSHDLKPGDIVRALRRPDFPEGIVVDVLTNGFVLVRWNGGLLETAQRNDIERIDAS